MIKKILLLAIVTFSLLVCGCEQKLPPADNPPQLPQPEVNQSENQPEKPPEKPLIEKPTENPQPKDNPTENKPVENNPAENPNTEQPQVVSPAAQNQKISVKVYYPDDAGINLVGVKRTIEIKNDSEKYLAAVQLLTTYPTEKDLTVIFPKNAKINSVTVENDTAIVDFDKNITKSFAGGSTGEELLVNSVVKTLTEFKEVKQVRFLVDGKEIETLSGHMDLSAPIKKSDV